MCLYIPHGARFHDVHCGVVHLGAPIIVTSLTNKQLDTVMIHNEHTIWIQAEFEEDGTKQRTYSRQEQKASLYYRAKFYIQQHSYRIETLNIQYTSSKNDE